MWKPVHLCLASPWLIVADKRRQLLSEKVRYVERPPHSPAMVKPQPASAIITPCELSGPGAQRIRGSHPPNFSASLVWIVSAVAR